MSGASLITVPLYNTAVFDVETAWVDLTMDVAFIGRNPGVRNIVVNLTTNGTVPTVFIPSSDIDFISRSYRENIDTMYTTVFRKPVYIDLMTPSNRIHTSIQDMVLLGVVGWKEDIQLCKRRFQIWPTGYNRGYDRCPLDRNKDTSVTFKCTSQNPFWPDCHTRGVLYNDITVKVGFDMRSQNIRLSMDVYESITSVGTLRVGALSLPIDKVKTLPLSDENGVMEWAIPVVVADSRLPNKSVVIGLHIDTPLSIRWTKLGLVTVEYTWKEDAKETFVSSTVLAVGVFVYFMVVLFPDPGGLASLMMVGFLVVNIYYLWTGVMAVTLHRATRIYTFNVCLSTSIIGVATSMMSCVAQILHIRLLGKAQKAYIHCSVFPFFAMSTLIFEMIPAAYLISFSCSVVMAGFITTRAMACVNSTESIYNIIVWFCMLAFVMMYLVVPVTERVTALYGNEIAASCVIILIICAVVILRDMKSIILKK